MKLFVNIAVQPQFDQDQPDTELTNCVVTN